MGGLFDPERMIPRNNIPEIFCHGPRHVEILPGGIVCVWMCQDQPVDPRGLPPASMPIVKVLIPINCYAWNVAAHTEWAFDRGILRMKPQGPVELRPRRRMLM